MDTAETLFAERGFYGVSVAAIASHMGLTKQGVLHYFNSKEKLYGAVLQRISDDFIGHQLDAEQSSEDPAVRLKRFYGRLATASTQSLRRNRLLIRELLDNNDRAAKAENWYLKDFLSRLIDMTRAVPAFHHLSDVQTLTMAYQWLGAVNYFLISPITLKSIFGAEFHGAMANDFQDLMNHQIDAQILLVGQRTKAADK